MPKEDWKNNPVHEIFKKENLWPFKDDSIISVLDVACGLSLKSKFLAPQIIVGVDIHEPYLKAIESDVPYVVIKADARQFDGLFLDNSFDVVYALDIIEHLEKEDALSLIRQCKRICRKAVIIETPNGYVPQNIDIQGFGADHFQTHRCGWSVEELGELGFECLVREYKMQDIKRHTDLSVNVNIELVDGIYLK
tara:strand:- start:767 stop:1348 length:582 start_codon:yes stop_codon:yes gene_type:complete